MKPEIIDVLRKNKTTTTGNDLTNDECEEINKGLEFLVIMAQGNNSFVGMKLGEARDYLCLNPNFVKFNELKCFSVFENKSIDKFVGKNKNIDLIVTFCRKDVTDVFAMTEHLKEHTSRNKQIENEIRINKEEMDTIENKLIVIRNKYKNGIDSSVNSIIRDLDKLKEDGKIIGYDLYHDCLVATTKDIYYKDERRSIENFYLGAYKIKIGFDDSIKIINYKRHSSKNIFHPNIDSTFSVCFGTFSEIVNLAVAEKKYALAVNLIINFLGEPNYGTPFNYIFSFVNMQDVTIRPRSYLEWFSPTYWDANELWDAERAQKESEEAKKTMPNFFN
jgi:hypothetical protein